MLTYYVDNQNIYIRTILFRDMSKSTTDELLNAFFHIRNAFEEQLHGLPELRNGTLTCQECRFLLALGEEPKTNSVIADEMYLSHGTVSVMVDHLIGKGLVVRKRPETGDRRQVLLRLTEKGTRCYQGILDNHREMVRTFLDRLDKDEGEELIRLLKKIQTTTEVHP
jgi:DNA-binding MarR family transcriptional regulator